MVNSIGINSRELQNDCPGCDTDGEASVIEFWEMCCTLSSSLLRQSGPGLVVPVKTLSMGQIEIFNHFL